VCHPSGLVYEYPQKLGWDVNGHTTRFTSPLSVVLRHVPQWTERDARPRPILGKIIICASARHSPYKAAYQIEVTSSSSFHSFIHLLNGWTVLKICSIVCQNCRGSRDLGHAHFQGKSFERPLGIPHTKPCIKFEVLAQVVLMKCSIVCQIFCGHAT